MQLKIEYVPAADLVPYSGNAKAHPAEQIEQIKASIAEFGFNDPIAVWKGNEIIEGHGRLLAAQEMGLDKVPVIRLDALTDEQRRAYTLAHNKLTMNSGFDIDILTAELGAIEEIDMEQFGFDFSDVIPEPEAEEDDFDEAPPEEPEAHVGDLYQLGRHRLICGDSTDTYVVDRLMGGVEADMVMTDPPYGINAEKMTMGSGAKEFYRGSDWDSERPSITLAMMLAPDVCIWGGNYFADELPISNDWLVWHKKNDGLSFSECELAWTNFGRNVRHLSHHWGKEKKLHVTMKPVPVIAWAIQQAKNRAEVIVDLFGGSGTTMIACEQLGRTCYMAELDPRYVDVIIKRWEAYTGEKAVLLNE